MCCVKVELGHGRRCAEKGEEGAFEKCTSLKPVSSPVLHNKHVQQNSTLQRLQLPVDELELVFLAGGWAWRPQCLLARQRHVVKCVIG